MIDRKSKISIRAQCELLGLHPSVLYYQALAETEENLPIMPLLDERYLSYPIDREWSIRRRITNARLSAQSGV